MATNKKPDHKGENPKADSDQSASQKSVDASHTPMGKDYRNLQDGDTKVQNPNRNLAKGGNNSDNLKKQ